MRRTIDNERNDMNTVFAGLPFTRFFFLFVYLFFAHSVILFFLISAIRFLATSCLHFFVAPPTAKSMFLADGGNQILAITCKLETIDKARLEKPKGNRTGIREVKRSNEVTSRWPTLTTSYSNTFVTVRNSLPIFQKQILPLCDAVSRKGGI